MNEEWRQAPGYVNYEVSNLGNVRRAAHTVTRTDGSTSRRPAKAIKIIPRGRGHKPIVHFCSATGTRNQIEYVEELVAEAFIGGPIEGHTIKHIDGDINNCRADNLELIEMSERDIVQVVPARRGPLQPCDTVRIVKPTDTRALEYWYPGMSKWIGHTMRVRSVDSSGLYVELNEDALAGDNGGDGYVWPICSCVPIEDVISLHDLNRRKSYKEGDSVVSVTENYVDTPLGWRGYIEKRFRDGTMLVTAFGESYRVRRCDFAGSWTPEPDEIEPGQLLMICDAGKLYPFNVDWLIDHQIDPEHMCRFAYSRDLLYKLRRQPYDRSVKIRVRCKVVLYDQADDVLLVEDLDDRACYLVHRTGVTKTLAKEWDADDDNWS